MDLIESLVARPFRVMRRENPESDLAEESPKHVELLGRHHHFEVGLSTCQDAP